MGVYLVESSRQFFAGIALRGFDRIKICRKTDRQQHQEIQNTEKKRLHSPLLPHRTGHHDLQSSCSSSTDFEKEDVQTGSPIKRPQHVTLSPSPHPKTSALLINNTRHSAGLCACNKTLKTLNNRGQTVPFVSIDWVLRYF